MPFFRPNQNELHDRPLHGPPLGRIFRGHSPEVWPRRLGATGILSHERDPPRSRVPWRVSRGEALRRTVLARLLVYATKSARQPRPGGTGAAHDHRGSNVLRALRSRRPRHDLATRRASVRVQLRMQRRLAEYRGVVVTLNESRVVVYDHSTSYYVVPRDTLERAEERAEEEQRPAKRMCSA
jgi:hypothetical protein